LSQQIASLESDFKRKLLVRSARGVKPTRPDNLYRYAKSIQRRSTRRAAAFWTTSGVDGNVTIGWRAQSRPCWRRRSDADARAISRVVLHISTASAYPQRIDAQGKHGHRDPLRRPPGDRPRLQTAVAGHFHLVAPRSMFPEQVHSADISASELAEIDFCFRRRNPF